MPSTGKRDTILFLAGLERVDQQVRRREARWRTPVSQAFTKAS
jgi:hypothetical protein